MSATPSKSLRDRCLKHVEKVEAGYAAQAGTTGSSVLRRFWTEDNDLRESLGLDAVVTTEPEAGRRNGGGSSARTFKGSSGSGSVGAERRAELNSAVARHMRQIRRQRRQVVFRGGEEDNCDEYDMPLCGDCDRGRACPNCSPEYLLSEEDLEKLRRVEAADPLL